MRQNRIYIGKLVHDRTEKVLNPMTRKHLIRPMDRANWQEVDASHLRIVDDATFDTVQERRQQYATHRPERSRRPRSAERRVGKECVRTCRSRWSTNH